MTKHYSPATSSQTVALLNRAVPLALSLRIYLGLHLGGDTPGVGLFNYSMVGTSLAGRLFHL